MPHFMDEMEPMEGMHLNVDLSVWLRHLSPTTRVLLGRIAGMWVMTVLGTLIAVFLPWELRTLGIFVDLQLWLSVLLWFVLNGVGYTACGILFYEADKYRKDHPTHLDMNEWERPSRRAS